MLASAGAFARPGAVSALSVCEEDGDDDEGEGEANEVAVETPRERPLLPCALAESGVLDASCADATFYVVTPQGILLCQIDVDLLVSSGTSSVERAPPVAPGSSSSAAPHALASFGESLAPPVAVERQPPEVALSIGPRDGHGRPPPTPS